MSEALFFYQRYLLVLNKGIYATHWAGLMKGIVYFVGLSVVKNLF